MNGQISNAKDETTSRVKTDAILGILGLGLGLTHRKHDTVLPTMPLIIPSIEDIKRFFVRKYESLHANPIHFMNDKCVISLARLLQFFHDHEEPSDISCVDMNTHWMTYYPCIRYNTSTSPSN